MDDPPRQLDGANVLCWAVSRSGAFYELRHGGRIIKVSAMTVCRYPDGDRYYLFKCDQFWNVVFDWDCESIHEAKALAGEQAVESLEWQSYT